MTTATTEFETRACDIHADGDPDGVGRCSRCRRYAFLVGYPPRSDAEEAEVHDTRAWLARLGRDPEWDIVPRVVIR